MLRRFVSAIVAFGALIALSPPALAERDPEQGAVEAAALLIREGKAAAALAAIEPPLAAYQARYENEKDAIYCADGPAQTLLYMGMAAAAKRSAIAIAPGWCSALFIKGFALIDTGHVAEGTIWLERAVAMSPSDPHYLNELGYAYQASRDWDRSIATYRRAEQAAGFAPADRRIVEQTRALRGIGYVYVEQGRWDEAAAMYRQCLALDPTDAKAKSELRYIADNRPRRS